MKVIIHGSEIKTVADFHEQVKKAFNAPEFYGENLDALKDVLTNFVQPPIHIIWVDFDMSKAAIGTYATRAKEVFEDVANSVNGYVFEMS